MQNPQPLLNPLLARERTVKNSDTTWKAPCESFGKLRCQADFRNENEAGIASGKRNLCGLNVDLCFSAAGHSMEKQG